MREPEATNKSSKLKHDAYGRNKIESARGEEGAHELKQNGRRSHAESADCGDDNGDGDGDKPHVRSRRLTNEVNGPRTDGA